MLLQILNYSNDKANTKKRSSELSRGQTSRREAAGARGPPRAPPPAQVAQPRVRSGGKCHQCNILTANTGRRGGFGDLWLCDLYGALLMLHFRTSYKHLMTLPRLSQSVAHWCRLSGTHWITSSTFRRGSLVHKCNVKLFTGYFVRNCGNKNFNYKFKGIDFTGRC